MLINPDPKIVNTRGCGPLMKYWYRRGFWENIFMSLFGIVMGCYMLFVFQRNRREYTQLRDEAEDRKRIVDSRSMASLRSTTNNYGSKTKGTNNFPQYAYTGVPTSSSNGTATAGYDSDNNSSNMIDQTRPMLNRNS
jgi:hypothetical protein